MLFRFWLSAALVAKTDPCRLRVNEVLTPNKARAAPGSSKCLFWRFEPETAHNRRVPVKRSAKVFMKKFAFLLLVAVPLMLNGQVTDDFSDGNDDGWTHYDP